MKFYCGYCWCLASDLEVCPHCSGEVTRLRKESQRAKNSSKMEGACAQYNYDSGCIVPGCPEPAILHHFVPRSKGGSDAVSNLIPICKKHEEPIHFATSRAGKF